MSLDDPQDTIALALRQLDRRETGTAQDVAAVRARLDALIALLVARETLNPGHQRHLDRVGAAAGPQRPRVRLRQYVDKYDMVHGAPVDCADRLPLCKARCCHLRVELTAQDLEERVLAWELHDPYVLRHDPADGRCTYLDRTTGACGTYEHRPASCREYSCKDDPRIWLDFDSRIPAPPRVHDQPDGM